jgi:nucleoside 2-deoxyribosyltransferase
MYIYIAGPLFSEGERWFNTLVKAAFTRLSYKSFLPQQDGILVAKMLEMGREPDEVFKEVYELDIRKLHETDALIAILDGAVIDEGTAFEIGYMNALGKPCYGIQTDSRRQLPTGNNPMIENSLDMIFDSIEELPSFFAKTIQPTDFKRKSS